MGEDKIPRRTSLIGSVPDALLIASGTGVAYWLSFRYEVAYLQYFGVPAHLVEVSLQTVLLVALGLSGAAWSVFMLGNLVAMAWPTQSEFRGKAARILFFLLIPVWFLLNYGFARKYWLAYSIAPIYIIVFEVLWPLVVFRKRGSIRERFVACEKADNEALSRNIGSRVHAALGPVVYYLFFFALLGTFFASVAGRGKAVTQEEYFVLSDAPNVVVLRVYGDKIIAAQFDRESKTVSAQLVIQEIGSEKLRLTREPKLGPLEGPKL